MSVPSFKAYFPAISGSASGIFIPASVSSGTIPEWLASLHVCCALPTFFIRSGVYYPALKRGEVHYPAEPMDRACRAKAHFFSHFNMAFSHDREKIAHSL
jgi:hypothetical protein